MMMTMMYENDIDDDYGDDGSDDNDNYTSRSQRRQSTTLYCAVSSSDLSRADRSATIGLL